MSFLLDALRKSELERRVGEVPRFTPELPVQPAGQKRHPFIIVIIVLVLINIGTLLYVTLFGRVRPGDPQENPPLSVAPQSISGSAGSEGPNEGSRITTKKAPAGETESGSKPIAPVRPSSAPNKADKFSTPGIIQTDRQAPGLAPPAKARFELPDNRVSKAVEKQAPVQQTIDQKQPRAAIQQFPPVEKMRRAVPPKPMQPGIAARPAANPEEPKSGVPEIQPVEKLATVLEAPPVDRPASDPSEAIPWLSGMPRNFQREIPSLDINVFVYSEVPDERFVVVNMSKYVSGQKLDSGPEILEIRPDSLVLEYFGRKFRIKRP